MSHGVNQVCCNYSANANNCARLVRFLICAIATLSAVAFPLNIRAETNVRDCILPALHENPNIQQFLDSGVSQDLAGVRTKTCDYLAGKQTGVLVLDNNLDVDWSTRRVIADEAWRTLVADAAWCGQKFSDWLQQSSFPEAHRAVFRGFCQRRYQNIEVLRMEIKTQGGSEVQQSATLETLKKISEPFRWFREEYFCTDSGYEASPGGWRGVTQPDIPAMRRLEDKADSLCDDVRNGTISVDEASYRWHQELLRFKRRVGPEITRQGIHSLSDVITSLIE